MSNLVITRVNTPNSKYSIKCPYDMTPQRIVVHNTANDASAMSEISYMLNNNKQNSFHFAVDDTRAVQGLPLNRNSWSAGDGKNGKGNREAISIEICYSRSGGSRFNGAEQNAAKLIALLLKQYGWNINKVTKHQQYSGKYCPQRTMNLGWNRFLKLVESEITALNPKQSSVTVSRASNEKPIKQYLSRGDKGPEVKKLQMNLRTLGYNIEIDESFGPATENIVRQFQGDYGLKADGFAGNATRNKIAALLGEPMKYVLKRGNKGLQVLRLQRSLSTLGFSITIDKSFGPAMERIVKSFQKKNGLFSDGMAGPKTQAKIAELLGK